MPRSAASALFGALFSLAAAFPALAAEPAIHIGVTVSSTGPAASLGISERNTFSILPKTIAGHPVDYYVLDDGTDATHGVTNMRKLIDEDNVDAMIGSTAVPASAAMIPVAAEKHVPTITLAASATLIEPPTGDKRWMFKTPQNDSLMADAIAAHMVKEHVKTIGFIGFNDGYGDSWLTEMQRAAKAHGMSIVDVERYARNDTSVTGQALKIIAAKPDAVLIVGAGTPAALPERTLRQYGYKGLYYQTHGAASSAFLTAAGKDAEGTFLPVGPVVVADQLPDSSPVKKVALGYIHAYEKKFGAGSSTSFGSDAYDAYLRLRAAIPVALKKGQPGTRAFRDALRDALEHQTNLVVTNGFVNTTPQDHNGLDTRARVMVVVKNGTWKLVP